MVNETVIEIYELLILAALFILGVGTGGLSNVTSGGAGVLTIYFLWNYADPNQGLATATGTVVAASTIIVFIGTISFYRKKQIDWQLGLTVGISGVVGAFIGGLLASSVANATFEHAFGIFCLCLAAFTTYQFTNEWKRKKKLQAIQGGGEEVVPTSGDYTQRRIIGGSDNIVPPDPSTPPPVQRGRLAGRDPLSLTVQITKGVLIGLATGLFGVALASLSIVLFIILFKLDTKMLLGTSLFASVFRYGGASVAYIASGSINLYWFALLAISGAIGSVIGARIMLGGGRFSKDIYVKVIVIAILLFIGYSFLTKS